MHRIDSPNANNGQFVAGNPITGVAPTYFTAVWCNALQEEPANLLEGGGIALDKGNNSQLRRLFYSLYVTQATALLSLMTNQLRCCKCPK